MLTTAYTRSWAGSEASPNGVRPRFYMEAVEDPLATAREGRPIFRDEERVELFMPGNQYHMPVLRVTDEHRQRWSREYEAFRQGVEMAPEGTPLEEWPILGRANVLELKALGLKVVEDIATLSDQGTQRAMGLMGLRTKARAFIDDAAAMALTEAQSKKIEEQNVEIARLSKQVEELGAITQRMHGELLGLKNQPNPIASVVPASLDPVEAARMQQAMPEVRGTAQSSLATFADERRERRQRRQMQQLEAPSTE